MKKIREKIEFINLYLGLGFLPLLVIFQTIAIHPEWANYYQGQLSADFFIEGKFKLLMALGLYGLGMLLWHWRAAVKVIKKEKSVQLFGLFVLVAVISGTLSAYPHTSFWGLINLREGVMTWLVYLVLFIQGVVLGTQQRRQRGVALFFLALGINGVLILLQDVGLDFMRNQAIRNLLFPPWLSSYRSMIGVSNTLNAGTLYNPNFVGSMAAIGLPLIYLLGRKGKKRGAYFFFYLFIFAMLLASGGTAGLVAIGGGLVYLLIFQRKKLLPKKYHLGLLVGMILLGLVFSPNLQRNFKDLMSPIEQRTDKWSEDRSFVEGIAIEGPAMKLIMRNQPDLIFLNHEKGIIPVDEAGNQLSLMKNEEGKYIPEEEAYQYVAMSFYKDDLFTMTIGYGEIPVSTKEGTFTLLQQNLEPLPLDFIERFGFENYERIGSGRGYIWSRSIPMIGKQPLIGSGLNTYALDFPQYDLLGKINFFGNVDLIVDKPHNFYLMILISTGFLGSLLLMSALVYMGLSIERDFLLVMVTYGLVLFFNDSMIFTSGPFFILLSILQRKEPASPH